MHLMALLAITVATLPELVHWLAVVLVLISLAINLSTLRRTRRVVWYEGNRWTIDNPQRKATLRSIDFLSRWLVIITLKPQSGFPSRVVIPFDSLSKDSYRLLRVRLRIEGHALINPNDPSKAG